MTTFADLNNLGVFGIFRQAERRNMLRQAMQTPQGFLELYKSCKDASERATLAGWVAEVRDLKNQEVNGVKVVEKEEGPLTIVSNYAHIFRALEQDEELKERAVEVRNWEFQVFQNEKSGALLVDVMQNAKNFSYLYKICSNANAGAALVDWICTRLTGVPGYKIVTKYTLVKGRKEEDRAVADLLAEYAGKKSHNLSQPRATASLSELEDYIQNDLRAGIKHRTEENVFERNLPKGGYVVVDRVKVAGVSLEQYSKIFAELVREESLNTADLAAWIFSLFNRHDDLRNGLTTKGTLIATYYNIFLSLMNRDPSGEHRVAWQMLEFLEAHPELHAMMAKGVQDDDDINEMFLNTDVAFKLDRFPTLRSAVKSVLTDTYVFAVQADKTVGPFTYNNLATLHYNTSSSARSAIVDGLILGEPVPDSNPARYDGNPSKFWRVFDNCKTQAERDELISWVKVAGKELDLYRFIVGSKLVAVNYPPHGHPEPRDDARYQQRRLGMLYFLEQNVHLVRGILDQWTEKTRYRAGYLDYHFNDDQDFTDEKVATRAAIQKLSWLFREAIDHLAAGKFPNLFNTFFFHILGARELAPEELTDETAKTQAFFKAFVENGAAVARLLADAREPLSKDKGYFAHAAYSILDDKELDLETTKGRVLANLRTLLSYGQPHRKLAQMFLDNGKLTIELLTAVQYKATHPRKINNRRYNANYPAIFVDLIKLMQPEQLIPFIDLYVQYAHKPMSDYFLELVQMDTMTEAQLIEFVQKYAFHASEKTLTAAALYVGANTGAGKKYSEAVAEQFWNTKVQSFDAAVPNPTIATKVKKYMRGLINQNPMPLDKIAEILANKFVCKHLQLSATPSLLNRVIERAMADLNGDAERAVRDAKQVADDAEQAIRDAAAASANAQLPVLAQTAAEEKLSAAKLAHIEAVDQLIASSAAMNVVDVQAAQKIMHVLAVNQSLAEFVLAKPLLTKRLKNKAEAATIKAAEATKEKDADLTRLQRLASCSPVWYVKVLELQRLSDTERDQLSSALFSRRVIGQYEQGICNDPESQAILAKSEHTPTDIDVALDDCRLSLIVGNQVERSTAFAWVERIMLRTGLSKEILRRLSAETQLVDILKAMALDPAEGLYDKVVADPLMAARFAVASPAWLESISSKNPMLLYNQSFEAAVLQDAGTEQYIKNAVNSKNIPAWAAFWFCIFRGQNPISFFMVLPEEGQEVSNAHAISLALLDAFKRDASVQQALLEAFEKLAKAGQLSDEDVIRLLVNVNDVALLQLPAAPVPVPVMIPLVISYVIALREMPKIQAFFGAMYGQKLTAAYIENFNVVLMQLELGLAQVRGTGEKLIPEDDVPAIYDAIFNALEQVFTLPVQWENLWAIAFENRKYTPLFCQYLGGFMASNHFDILEAFAQKNPEAIVDCHVSINEQLLFDAIIIRSVSFRNEMVARAPTNVAIHEKLTALGIFVPTEPADTPPEDKKGKRRLRSSSTSTETALSQLASGSLAAAGDNSNSLPPVFNSVLLPNGVPASPSTQEQDVNLSEADFEALMGTAPSTEEIEGALNVMENSGGRNSQQQPT